MSDRSTFNPIDPPEPPTPAPQLSATVGDQPAAPFVAVGREFGEYDQLKEIARGGMGVVFEARQRKLNRKVALKMILAGQLARPTDVERFQAEARAAAALDHPNIVPIHEVGEHGGQHYFTMKLIEGGSMQAHLPRLRSDVRAAARLLATVARAVQFAHDKGILHRDLKPGNVLIEQRGEELVPHLTDFGLAKVLNEASLTASGAIVGTPAYVAPEQASGGAKPVSARSDVYSLGAMLYEILTGRPPFQAPTAMEVLLKVINDEPPPPRALDRTVNRDLETICLKCLNKEPDRRYDSAQALAEDLERWLSGEPIIARPMTRGERVRRWAWRNPVGVLLLLGLLLAGTWLVSRVTDVWQQWRQIAIDQQVEQAEESLKHGEELCQQGKIEGLLWIARALEQSPPPASEQQERIRDALAGWLRVRNGRDVLPGTWVDEVVVSPDGRTVATVTRSELVARLFDVESGKPLGKTIWHPQSAWAVGFRNKDSKLIEAVLPGGLLFAPVEKRASRVKALELSPDGELLLTQEGNQTLRLYRVSDGQPVGEAMVEQGNITAARFSPDGGAVVSWTQEAEGLVPSKWFVRLWSAPTGRARTKPLTCSMGQGDLRTVSPDGSLLVRKESSTFFELIDVRTGEALSELGEPPQQGKARQLSRSRPVFAPDSRTLVCGRSDHTLEVWDLKQPRKPRLVTALQTPANVNHVEFSRDGATFLAANPNVWVACWSTRNWTAAGKRIGPSVVGAGLNPLLTPDGKGVLLAFSKPKRVLVLCDVETGARRAEFDWSDVNDSNPPHLPGVRFSPDGKRLIINGGSRLYVLDVATGKRMGDPIPSLDSTTLSPDGKQLLLVGHPNVVTLWDSTSGQRLGEQVAEKWFGQEPLFAPNGDWLAWSGGSIMRLYNVKDSRDRSLDPDRGSGWFPPSLFRPLCRPSCQFSPDGRWLLTNSGRLLELDRPHGVARRLDDQSTLQGGGFLRGGQHILASHGDGERTIRLWETNTAKNLGRRQEGPNTRFMAFPSAGDRWFAASEHEVKCYQGLSNQPIWHFDSPEKLTDLALTPDDRTVAVLLEDEQLLLLDPSDGRRRGNAILYDNTWGRKQLWSLPFPRTGVVAFSPNGRFITTAVPGPLRVGERALRQHLVELLVCFQGGPPPPLPLRPLVSGLVHVWDAQTGKPVGEPLKHPRTVVAVTYSADGKLLATGCEDGTVRIWDAASGRQLGPAMPHDGPVLRLAFDPQGKTLWASAVLDPHLPSWSYPAQHRVWDVSPPRDGSPQRMRTWLEIQTRRTLDGDAVRDLDDDELTQRRQTLDRLGGPPS